MTRSPSLLVNYWYAHPVGHALEGMRYALGYKGANPEMHVSLLLNGATAVELARCCTFIDDVYAVPFTEFHDAAGDPAEALAGVPRSWDWVVENHRAREDSHKEMHGFRAFFHAAREHFSTRHPVGVAGRDAPAYEPHQDLRVELPADACAAAAATTGGRQAIAVVLAGSSAARHLYPSAGSWELILGALSEGHPEAALLLIGKHAPDGRTTSRPSERRGSRSRAGTGTSTSSTASRSTRCSRTRSGIRRSRGTASPAKRCRRARAGRGRRRAAHAQHVDRAHPRRPARAAPRGGDPDRQAALVPDALAAYFPRLLAAYDGDRTRAFSFDDIGELYLPTTD